MPVRGRAVRDGVPRVLGLARSPSRQPACAWRRVCDLRRHVAQAVSHHGGGARHQPFPGEDGRVASFCRRCGTPLIYERTRSRHIINIPRALFQSRTGRQPIYHIGIEEMQDWAYAGEPLVPLKGYPGVFWKRSKKKVAHRMPDSQHRSGRVAHDHFFRRNREGSSRCRCGAGDWEPVMEIARPVRWPQRADYGCPGTQNRRASLRGRGRQAKLRSSRRVGWSRLCASHGAGARGRTGYHSIRLRGRCACFRAAQQGQSRDGGRRQSH